MKRVKPKSVQARLTELQWLKIEYLAHRKGLNTSEVLRDWAESLPEPPSDWNPVQN